MFREKKFRTQESELKRSREEVQMAFVLSSVQVSILAEVMSANIQSTEVQSS
jgi:hypothetical protein